MLTRKTSIWALLLTLFFTLSTVNASTTEKTEEDFSGILKVTSFLGRVIEKEFVFPTPTSPLKVQKYYFSSFKISSSNFYTAMEMVKKAIHEATPSYKSYIPVPVKDINGVIIGLYAEKEAQTYELPKDYAKNTRAIANNGVDLEGLKEGVIDNCKVLFRHSVPMLGMDENTKTVGTVSLFFHVATPENSKCEVYIEKEGERIASAFKESLKKLIADSVTQKPSTETTGKTSNAPASASSTSVPIANALSINCTAGNVITCPPAMVLDIVGFFTNLGKKSKVEEAMKMKNKEEQDIRDKCIEIMKDKPAAVISLENNMRLECIKEYGLVKAKFFKDGVLIRQVVKMVEGQLPQGIKGDGSN